MLMSTMIPIPNKLILRIQRCLIIRRTSSKLFLFILSQIKSRIYLLIKSVGLLIQRFYYDSDIGFDSQWQTPIHEAQMDDDVLSDDDQIYFATKHCLMQANQAIKDYTRNPSNVRNYRKYHHSLRYSV